MLKNKGTFSCIVIEREKEKEREGERERGEAKEKCLLAANDQ